MRSRTMLGIVGATALAIVTTTACGVDGGSPTASCTDSTTSAGEPGAAEPMLVLGDPASSPTIVYADGAVVVPISALEAGDAAGFLHAPMMAPGFSGDQPGGFEGGSLTDCELEVVTELADDLFTDDVDFGSPQITDSGSTIVSYRGESHSIYAYSRDEPDEFSDLSGTQNRARADLADLWDLVEQQADLDGELPIDRLLVRTFGDVSDADVIDWPLDQPLSELLTDGCATLTDPGDIELLVDRLGEGDLVDSRPPLLAITAQAPGTPDCP
jgi:hypothetical protein